MLDAILSALITPGPAWIGTLLGILPAYFVWNDLPESSDRVTIAALFIAGGFIAGLLWSLIPSRKEK